MHESYTPTPLPPQPRREEPVPQPPRRGRLQGMTVIVDAGHGGKDPGTQALSSVPEKTITLGIARQLAGMLQAQGASVIMTRNSDVFISLDDRAASAERNHVDLLISIHADSAPNDNARGCTLYIARGASTQSEHAATHIELAMQRNGIECRGIQRAGFRVLIGHSRPSILIECGFLTNRSDADRLIRPDYQQQIAAAITEGVTQFATDRS